jgi:hypothetical protein
MRYLTESRLCGKVKSMPVMVAGGIKGWYCELLVLTIKLAGETKRYDIALRLPA